MTKLNISAHRIVKHDVIAICGSAGSGKDSFFKLWNNKPFYPASNVKFAEPLNKILHAVLGKEVPYEERNATLRINTQRLKDILELEVGQGASNAVHVVTDHFSMSWRELAQYVGTAVIRSKSPNFFVDKAKEVTQANISSQRINFLTDARFENEINLATLAVLLKRDEDVRLEFDSYTHESEKVGEHIAVWSNRYLACRDQGQATLADYCYDKVKESVGIEVHAVYQTLLDADNVLQFKPLQEAYRCFEFEKDVRDMDWFMGE